MIARVEPRSFWFRARNRLIVSTVRAHFAEAESLLEVGCGTGFVLAGLRDAFPAMRLVGGELFPEALEFARRRLPDVELVKLDATEIPFETEFDVVAPSTCSSTSWRTKRRLRECTGLCAATAGSCSSSHSTRGCGSEMDVVARHARRYTRRQLASKVERAGFDVVAASSFVSALLPAMILSRAGRRVLGRQYHPVAELEPARLNRLFELVLNGERRLIERGWSLPAGGSLLLVARKR